LYSICCLGSPAADAGFSLRATSALAPAATFLVTSPIASLPGSQLDPAPTYEELCEAVVKAMGDFDAEEYYRKVEWEEFDALFKAEAAKPPPVGAWWEGRQWHRYLDYDELEWLSKSLDEATGGKSMSEVAVHELACQLRAKFEAGNQRVKVRGARVYAAGRAQLS
jgi:methionine synthase II (cobalamin-independent)